LTRAKAAFATINIRPDVGVFSVFSHLNYRPWYALAEFVDNALESFLRHRKQIGAADGTKARLDVEVTLDPSDGGTITIRDNAAGIYEHEYQRAFHPAEPPPDIGGLAEFGMGMKSAACWFGRKFTVRSTALGEPVERTVTFDVDEIVRAKSDELPVITKSVPAEHHYTEIVLTSLNRAPQGKTVSKIKEHLASIYRVFIQEGTLSLRFRAPGVDETLTYKEPEILSAPPDESVVRKHKGKVPAAPQQWRKDIEFDLGGGMRVHGFAALRKKADTARNGFALFRRKRLIEGSGEDSYRPPEIFGAKTTAVYQRLFGELHLEGFEVSHTKDGFRWDENEEPFLKLLREHLNAAPMPLIDQAREASYSQLQMSPRDISIAVTTAVKDTSDVLQATAGPVVDQQIHARPDSQAPPSELPPAQTSWQEKFDLELHGTQWEVAVEVTGDPGIADWIRVFDNRKSGAAGIRRLGVSLSLTHAFTSKFVGADLDRIKPFVRLAAAIGLAEITARESGVKQAGEMRRNINQLLKDSLSKS